MLVYATRALRELYTAQLSNDAAASSFLRAVAPVRWTPVKKKSAWRHALCAGLAGWLAPATVAQGPRAAAWAEALAAVRVDTLAWVAKAERKHMAHGYPLASALLCAEADEVQLRAFLEGPLLRALRDKERAVRAAALESLCTAVRFYAATRSRPPHGAPDELWVATAAAIAAIPASFRRAGGSQPFVADAAVDTLASIAASAVQVDCALVLEVLLPELLKEPPSSEAAVAALRALTGVVAVAGVEPMQDTHSAPPACDEAGLAHALTRMRRGQAALGELGIGGALPVQLRSALGTVARAASAVLASASVVNKKGEQPSIDATTCAMVCALLDCVPYVMPDDWRNDGALAAALPSFIWSSDAALRSAGAAALRRAMHVGVGGRDRSSARALLLEAAVEHALRSADTEALSSKSGVSNVDASLFAAHDALTFALTASGDWRAAAALDASEVSENSVPAVCSWSRIEGAAVILACISNAATRQAALALIRDVAVLSRHVGHSESPLADLLADFLGGSDVETHAADAVRGDSADGRQWVTAFGVALARSAPYAQSAVLTARAHSLRLMQTTLSIISRGPDDAGVAVDVWRSAACVAVASLNVPESSDQAAARALLVKAIVAPLRGSLSQLRADVSSALSCATPAGASALVAELLSLAADSARAQGRLAAELRHAAALIVRSVAAIGALNAALVKPLSAFVEDALAAHPLVSTPDAVGATVKAVQRSELSPEAIMSRLAVVETAVAVPGTAWPTQLRARLFDACAVWSLASSEDLSTDIGVGKSLASPGGDGEGLSKGEHLTCTMDKLQRSAADACATLAVGIATDSAFSAAKVLQWTRRALELPHSVNAARRALCAAATSDFALLPLLLDAAYLLEQPATAAAHFSALVSCVGAQCKSGSTLPPVALFLAVAIQYSVDTRSEARSDVVALLQALPDFGAFEEACTSRTSDLTGDSIAPSLRRVASRLALDAPALCRDTCCELLRRALQVLRRVEGASPCAAAVWRALSVLPAWLEGASLELTEAGAMPELLTTLFSVCCFSTLPADEGAECRDALWTALCSRASNATLVAEFLLQQHLISSENLSQPLSGPERLKEQNKLCIERCLHVAAAAQPRAVASHLLAALRTPRSDPSCTTGDAALELLAVVSAAPSPDFRTELRAAAPASLHAALLVMCRDTYNDSIAGAASKTVTAPTPKPREHELQASARKLLNSVALLERTTSLATWPGKQCDVRSASRRRAKAASGAQLSLISDAVFDTLAVLDGCSASVAAERGAVLRNACAAEVLGLLAESPSHAEALSAVAVLRTLRRPLCQASTAVLCECIVACLSPGRASRAPHAAGVFAAQCLAVLAAAAEVTAPANLLLYPCVFWAAAAALRAPSAPLVPHACALLLSFSRALASSRPDAPPGVAEEVLLLAAPGVAGLPGAAAARGASFPGLARLALHASCTASSELAPLLLAQLAALPRGGAADALYGDAEARFWLALGGALPWILSVRDARVAMQSATRARLQAAGSLAAAARFRRGSTALVAALEAIAAGTFAGMDACATLRAPLALALTPAAAALTAATLLEVLHAGEDGRTLPALALLQAVFDAPCGVRPTPDLTPLTAAAAGPHGAAARAALVSALGASSRSGGGAAQPASAAGSTAVQLWPEADAEAAAGLLSDALAGAGAKRRDAPGFLFQ